MHEHDERMRAAAELTARQLEKAIEIVEDEFVGRAASTIELTTYERRRRWDDYNHRDREVATLLKNLRAAARPSRAGGLLRPTPSQEPL